MSNKTCHDDNNEWWHGIFTEREAREIEQTLSDVQEQHAEFNATILQVPVEYEPEAIVPTFVALAAWLKTNPESEIYGPIRHLAVALGTVYANEDLIPPDEDATDAYIELMGWAEDIDPDDLI